MDGLKTRLIKIAAELALCRDIRSPEEMIESLPKSTSRKTLNEIYIALKDAESFSKRMSQKVRQAADTIDEPTESRGV